MWMSFSGAHLFNVARTLSLYLPLFIKRGILFFLLLEFIGFLDSPIPKYSRFVIICKTKKTVQSIKMQFIIVVATAGGTTPLSKFKTSWLTMKLH